MRRGATLPELLISLVLTALILGLAAHHAVEQLRLVGGIATLVGMRGQLGHASAIAARRLWSLSPRSDMTSARDSAIEFFADVGSAIACGAPQGQLAMPRIRTRGNTFAAFWEMPDVGDRVTALFADSVSVTWLTLHVAATPIPGPACVTVGESEPGLLVQMREAVSVPPGAALRFHRPTRLSLYKAADARWYLGGRDWNGLGERFNTIQPLAGPLQQYSASGSETGLLFSYFDAWGLRLDDPVDASRVASIGVLSRAQSETIVRIRGRQRYGDRARDSATAVVALPNAR